MDQKYSHRSNGNPKSQSGRTGGGRCGQKVRSENESTGDMSDSEMIGEGVSHKEPFDYQIDDLSVYPTM